MFNLGVDGHTSTDILKRFDIEADARKPTAIVFAIGVNDSAYLLDTNEPITDVDIFKKNIEILIKKANVYTKNIIFIGLVLGDDSLLKPYPESSRGESYESNRVKKFDDLIKKIAHKNSCQHIDIFKHLEFTDFSDGLHPNEAGHKKMYEIIRTHFERAIE